MKRNLKLALAAVCLCSLSAFSGLKAQEVVTEEVIVGTDEYVDEVVEEKSTSDLFDAEVYYSYLTMNPNKAIGDALGANMPEHGIGVGFRWMVNPTKHFLFGYNLGFSYGLRTYTESEPDPNIIQFSKRTFTQNINLDVFFGAKLYFTKNLKNGMDIFGGFGYDYGELHLSQAEPGYAMVASQKIIQHAFYVPVGIRFFFGDMSIAATYRWRAFDMDMTVESMLSQPISHIPANETLNLFPLEISIGLKF